MTNTSTFSNTSVFQNLCWSGYSVQSSFCERRGLLHLPGIRFYIDKAFPGGAVAVHDGDVAAPVIPRLETWLLASIGLAITTRLAQRSRQHQRSAGGGRTAG